MDITFRLATVADAAILAPLNAQLIRDEGHRNLMTVQELEQRMATWLACEYEAILFDVSSELAGYALFRREPEYIYLRQLFVVPSLRRRGIGRSALAWLWRNAWVDARRLRVDVLAGNKTGEAFWRSAGFTDYCLTMEAESPMPPGACIGID